MEISLPRLLGLEYVYFATSYIWIFGDCDLSSLSFRKLTLEKLRKRILLSYLSFREHQIV